LAAVRAGVVGGGPSRAVGGDRSVDVFVRKLRAKLEQISPEWRYVHTHFGVGYRFAAEPVIEVREPDRRGSPARETHAAVP
jgi:DNA-binding winged helix-turn-helix (wHTH) protein